MAVGGRGFWQREAARLLRALRVRPTLAQAGAVEPSLECHPAGRLRRPAGRTPPPTTAHGNSHSLSNGRRGRSVRDYVSSRPVMQSVEGLKNGYSPKS